MPSVAAFFKIVCIVVGIMFCSLYFVAMNSNSVSMLLNICFLWWWCILQFSVLCIVFLLFGIFCVHCLQRWGVNQAGLLSVSPRKFIRFFG